MNIEKKRIAQCLHDILSNTRDIEILFKEHRDDEIICNKHLLKSLKYSLLEMSEAMSLVLQHILAKQHGVPVKGYIDTVKKAAAYNIIPQELSTSLKPFFDFRNALVHRYWSIDDTILLNNCKAGLKGFFEFIETIEKYLGGIEL